MAPLSSCIETRLVSCAGKNYQVHPIFNPSSSGGTDPIIPSGPGQRVVCVGFIIETHKTDFECYFVDAFGTRLTGNLHVPVQGNLVCVEVREYFTAGFEQGVSLVNLGGDNGYVTAWYYLRND